jgi:Rab GDP dissociation inhibitor
MSSYQHNVADTGKYIAVCSGNLELGDDEEYDATKDKEYCTEQLKSALKLFGVILEQFEWVSEYYKPQNNSEKDGCYITSSYDATTHFETCCNEVMETYEKIIGEPLDLEIAESEKEDGEN